MNKTTSNPIIPKNHPRSESLHYRHKLVDGMKKNIVTPSGLCAHGRGEAYDYMMGEKTSNNAIEAMTAAIASLLCASHPIISVNGNIAALVPQSIVALSEIINAQLEINLFYQTPGRIEAIEKTLRSAGAKKILGLGDVESMSYSNLSSNRRIVDPRGIYKADVVLIPLEDGDRAEALIENGKEVITIDLNPLSRTAQKSNITIVDNIVRCIPKMIEIAKTLCKLEYEEIYKIKNKFKQKENLKNSIDHMIKYLKSKNNL